LTASSATGTPPFTYLWAPGGETSTAITVTVAATYTVEITDDNGCVDTSAGEVVTVNPLPTPTITETCGDPLSTLDAGAGYASYSWTSVPPGLPGDAETGQTIQVDCNTVGSYTVTVSDGTCLGTSPAEDVSNCTCGAVIPQPEPNLTMNTDGTQHLVVPHDAATTQYHVYRNSLASFNQALAEDKYDDGGTVVTMCALPVDGIVVIDNLDGTATVNYDLPPDQWMLITAATDSPGSESTVGVDSDGTERTDVVLGNTWAMCGP
jgi:hypothetical protein